MAKWHDQSFMWKGFADIKGIHGTMKESMHLVIGSMLAKELPMLPISSWEDARHFLQTFRDRQDQPLRYPDGSPARMMVATLNQVVELRAEYEWVDAKRPYYNVYPSVAEAFTRVDLTKVDCSLIKLPLPDLVIRFQVGKELQASETTKVRSVLVHENVSDSEKRGWLLAINTGETADIRTRKGEAATMPVHTIIGCKMDAGSTISDHLRMGRERPISDDEIDNEAVDNVLKLVATLCLIGDNPEIIQRSPLEADKAKWEKNHDPALIAKAERRGVRGWEVGAHIEVAPGYRIPHFAIRWCGPGGADPRLRPIKGCLVHRHKITEMPTGYLDDAIDGIVEDNE
jgi:hypothetical protein